MLDTSADFELPRLRMNGRVFAEIEHRPVPDLVLPNGQSGEAIAVGRTRSPWRLAFELDVDARRVERDLPLDVPAAALYE
jgi:hypothetical protein